MALPQTRAEFKKVVKRRLGWPVIEINLPDETIEDRIDEALKYFAEYHFDGTEKLYYKIEITPQVITDKYVTLPENIIGVVELFDINTVSSSAGLFDAKFQIMLSELMNFQSFQLAPFYYTMTHIETLQQLLQGHTPIRYNRNRNRLHIDTDWSRIEAGTWMIAVCYEVVDPVQFADVWKDKWLTEYTAAIIKQNWGEVLSKFPNVPLVGGITMNGDKMKFEATEEIAKLKNDLYYTYSLPTAYIIG